MYNSLKKKGGGEGYLNLYRYSGITLSSSSDQYLKFSYFKIKFAHLSQNLIMLVKKGSFWRALSFNLALQKYYENLTALP